LHKMAHSTEEGKKCQAKKWFFSLCWTIVLLCMLCLPMCKLIFTYFKLIAFNKSRDSLLPKKKWRHNFAPNLTCWLRHQ
jgi:hypothetical protein